MKNRLTIEFDRDAIEDKPRVEMEEALEDVLLRFGWTFSGSGADVESRGVRLRDMQYDRPE